MDVQTRWRQHRSDLNCGRHHCISLQRAWLKYGRDAFEFLVIEDVPDIECLLQREQAWIDRLRVQKRGYNVASFAVAPMRGRHHTPEAIAKQRVAQTGKPHPLSPEARSRAAARLLLRPMVRPAEATRRMAAALRGRTLSPETRAKMSVAKQLPRKPLPLATREKLSKIQSARKKGAEHMAALRAGHKAWLERRPNGTDKGSAG